MIAVIVTLKLLVEIALFALMGQGVLALLAGVRRHQNPVYRFFKLAVSPATRLVRLISPRFLSDRHIPLATSLVLAGAWITLTTAKVCFCIQNGINICK